MCGTVVDPDGRGVVRAVEQVALSPSRVVDGSEVVFHAACYPVRHPGYRRIDTAPAMAQHSRGR
ncbi:MAG TPA: hypothetical protein VFB41_03560 [Solirubrobacteraceae bacterium]|nr:hypothetical protein [Solirubrobacteraceae bacterium]